MKKERRKIIRQIATGQNGRFAALAEYDTHVQVWDLLLQERIGALETIFTAGGPRLALSIDGAVCAAGAYHVDGIVLYDVRSSDILWQRKDLKKVQRLDFSRCGNFLYCSFERKTFHILRVESGETETTKRGIERIWENRFAERSLVDLGRKHDYSIVNNSLKKVASCPRKTFGVLDVEFSEESVCITESTGPISCYSLADGEQIWQWSPGEGIHALTLGFNKTENYFTALTWPYMQGGPSLLLKIDPGTGSTTQVLALEGNKFSFVLDGTILLSSLGSMYNVANGRKSATLPLYPPTVEQK